MKEKIKIFIILSFIFILIIFLIKILFFKEFLNIQKTDDYTFFKLISNRISKQENTNQLNEYEFKVKYNDMNFKTVNLSTKVDKQKIVYEKIAPGSNGNFNIILDSNENLKYRIIFESKNEKPQNLNFLALENEKVLGQANTLEELSQYLEGNISKNKKVNITINWYWNYENKENIELADIQDTEDAKKIEKYQFNIYAYGEQMI